MTTRYFGSSSSSGNGGVMPMRPSSLAGKTINVSLLMSSDTVIPVMRSGVNHRFTVSTTSPLTASILLTNNATDATIATIPVNDVIASGNWIGFYLDSTDQCLYVLARNSSTGAVQLDKIDDSTGSRVHIGSSFAPTTTANWIPVGGLSGAFLQRSGSTLEVNIAVSATKTVKHTINITTGAVITQNVAAQIDGTSGDRPGPTYVTADGAYGVTTFPLPAATASTGNDQAANLFTTSNRGLVRPCEGCIFPELQMGALTTFGLIAIDSTRVCLSNVPSGGASAVMTNNVFPREEVDRVLSELGRMINS